MTWHARRALPPVAAGFGAVALGDLIVGLAAFSSITLGSLWFFAWEWIQLRGEYLARGLTFGAPWQVGLAWFGVVAAFPLLVLTVFLAVRAMELPRRVYRFLRGAPSAPERPVRPRRTTPTAEAPCATRPDYVAGFWSGSP
jgi:hypothetical protein